MSFFEFFIFKVLSPNIQTLKVLLQALFYITKVGVFLFVTFIALSSPVNAETPPELDFIGGYYQDGEYRCYSEPCFTIHRGTDAAASRVRPFAPQDWQAKRGECQKSYTKVLAENSISIVKYAKHEDCVFVVSGEWQDAYTGQKIDDIRVIALDHRISPYEAHYWGAAFWTPAQRFALLNDSANLVPVSIDQIKLRKGRSPTEWMPERKDYWCDYIVHREIVVRKYQLRPSKEVRDFNQEIKKLYCKF
tara:strand:- start:1347 stop:2090 length:744 start_codon:yes stop_codon:yes gene_type:complete